MKITVFRGFDDDYRRSMTLYSESLVKSLRACAGRDSKIREYAPFPDLSTPRIGRYLCQYGIFPLEAFLNQGDVSHVSDHSYSHLLHVLNPAKTVVTFHDAIWLKVRDGRFEEKENKNRRWIHSFNLSGLRKAARIICDSEASRRALLHSLDYPEEKIAVIPPGLHEIFDSSAASASLDGLNEGPYLLHVGHTQAYKNIPALFHVLSLLKSRGKKIKLLKVGTPFTEEQKHIAADLGVCDEIIHLGKVRQDQLPAVYKAARVLLMPSFDEGFGFPVLEAMSVGIPVIVSNRGSLPELAGSAGILVNPEDYSGMAQAVCEILEKPELTRHLILEGKKQAQLYSWEVSARKIFNVYQDVFNETGKAG